MTIDQYVQNINSAYQRGTATEHTYRGYLSKLIETLVPDVIATNEPKRQQCGAPDYILTKKDIPVGFIEAKDVGDKDLAGLKKTGNKEQFDRYKNALNNLLFTDYIDFHLYSDGVFITKIAIASSPDPSKGGEIVPIPENFAAFANLIKDFCGTVSQTIKSSKKLAEMMAGKARLLSDVIEQALTSDETHNEDSTLKDQMNAFREILIHDITPKGFADVYSQTIAYGMFAARLHDPTLPTFSRQEAAELIPKSNPFLRKLFGYIAGPDIDDRIKWIVDSLVEIFLACNVAEILKNYGKSTKMEDPIIHFYETFLSEYDPKLRKARGVWYTPKPVVNFIVRAVDDILKTEFDLPQGLADTSKTKIKVNVQATDKRYKDNIRTVEEEVHRVQILDPATGTGTFLAEVVKHIHKKFKGQQGVWSNYVETHLLPRLNGFELLMASYAMAHLQMDLLLTDLGYAPSPSGRAGVGSQRFKIYLTNSLEESHPDTGTLFANWLSSEANEANFIKRDTPVMCIVGNPPYAKSSTNKGKWIQNLITDYKKDLNERKINLDDDYIKFIRYGQHFIDKNGSGVLAYISNNSFIDGVTHRQMRKNLLESFDSIYILDLHGNANQQEVCLDGSVDQNVFDIMQGVSINIFVKTGKKKVNELGKVFQYDLQGKRDFKYDFLNKNSLKSLNWNKLEYKEPYYFFAVKKVDDKSLYHKGFEVENLFINKNTGIQTKNDALTIQFSLDAIKEIENNFISLDNDELKKKYGIKEGTWKISDAKADLLNRNHSISDILIKPFDKRYTLFNKVSGGFLGRPRYSTMKNMLGGENLALLLGRQNKSNTIDSFFITNTISEMKSAERTVQSYHFPLYIYPETNGQQQMLSGFQTLTALDADKQKETPTRTPNLNLEIVNQIAKQLDLAFVPEKESEGNVCMANSDEVRPEYKQNFAPIDILDYIYAVLHSPAYREKYKEFLKIDFPKIPYPKEAKTFWELVALGSQIRQIHLLESPIVEEYITEFNVDGDCVVGKLRFEINGNPNPNRVQKPVRVEGKVFINETQYFENVPEVAWNFYIGGYQPAQKWLKDRKERKLEFDDIAHYQKIIVALTETDRLMKAIDAIEIE